jgi:hypothetical protein
MVVLDDKLLADARAFIGADDIHRMKELVVLYEEAVSLHNAGWPSHQVYDAHPERVLRREVANHQLAELHTRSAAVFARAGRLCGRSDELQRRSDGINRKINNGFKRTQ